MFFKKKPEKIKQLIFDPLEDITAYELAKLIRPPYRFSLLIGENDNILRHLTYNGERISNEVLKRFMDEGRL